MPGLERPTAAPGVGPDGTGSAVPRVVTAQPGLVVALPFTLAAASVLLRGGDLYLQQGDQLVVIRGYGPALDAGQPPVVLDPRGDTLTLGLPNITRATPVILTEVPAPPPPAEYTTASVSQHFGGALLTVFDPIAHALGAFGPSTSGRSALASGTGDARLADESVPDFGGITVARFAAAGAGPAAPGPFEAKDDAGGVRRGDGSGNVLTGWGAAPDLTTGGTVTKAAGLGVPVDVTVTGVDVAGRYGMLHIATDGSATYHRTVGGVADLAALPNGATDGFTYTLLNGDGRSDTATLTVRVMPETVATGDTIGSDFDEALRLAPGASGQLSGLGGEDRLFGATGSDVLLGGADNDFLQPDTGTDTMDGGAGDDVLDLAGNLSAADQIVGGSGSDTMLLDGKYGAGVVFAASTLGEVELIRLATGNSYKLTLNDANNAVTLTVDGKTLSAGNVLTLNGAAETGAALIAHAGAGNDVLTGGGGMDLLDGGAGNDTLSGNAGADVLTAGSGNDVLSGGAGNDRLVLDGNLTAADKIDGGADTDTLVLAGDYAAGVAFTATTLVNVETVSLTAGSSYKFTLNDANNTAGLTIDGTALGAGNTLTVVGTAEASAALIAQGGAGKDVLTGGGGKDMLVGGADDDSLTGNNGDDTLVAGSGSDKLVGGNNNDVFDLGANLDATDRIDGGSNADTLKLDGDYRPGIVFAATTLVNVESINLAAGHDYALKLTDANNTTGITVSAGALGSGDVVSFDGAAETASPFYITAGSGDDVLASGSGGDTLNGGAGNDILAPGSGADTVNGGAGDDLLNLGAGLSGTDKIDGGADYDIVTLKGNYAAGLSLLSTTITNVEEIDLAAGSSYKLVLNNATASAGLKIDGTALATAETMTIDGSAETSAALTLLGGAARDVLTGGAGDDVIDGGSGNDVLTTGAGVDTVHAGQGDDSIVLAANLTAADAIDGGTGNDTVTLNGNYAAGVTLAATTLSNVETITLANGFGYRLILDDATNVAGLVVNGGALTGTNALTLDGSAETSAALTATGGAGNDTLIGGAGGDLLGGGSGNDLLRAGAGIDTLTGGSGNDTMELGGDLTAADKLDGGANADTLKLDGDYGAGLVLAATTVKNVETILLAAGHDYALTLDNATNTAGLTVDAAALGAAHRLILNGAAETASALTALGGSGDDAITGGTGNDLLQGGAGADLLMAGSGNDRLQGGTGDDVLVLGANLTAADQIDGGADFDTLKLSGSYANLTFGATSLTNVERIELAAGGSFKFTLHDANDTGSLAIDGSALLSGQTLTVNGAAETGGALLLTGGTGNDALTGGGGGDVLTGGAGNDTFNGNAGADLLFGGSGNDTLTGGTGADTFRFGQGDSGKDTVKDFKLAEGDVLEFTSVVDGAGSDIQDLIDAGFTAKGSGGNCVISWNGGASSVTLTGVGGAVASVNDLATLLGPQLHVTH